MKTGHNLLQKLIDQFSLAFVFLVTDFVAFFGKFQTIEYHFYSRISCLFFERKVYSDLISFVKVRRRTFFARINFDKKRMCNNNYWEGED